MELDQIIAKSFLLLVYLCYLVVSVYFLVRSFRKLSSKDKFIFLEAIFLFLCLDSEELFGFGCEVNI